MTVCVCVTVCVTVCVCVRPCVCVCASGRVEVQQVSMFLLKGNTLLTFFLTSSRSYTEPLLEQLRGDRTLLRNSADASFLMYRVMDTIVDHMQLISNEYDRILDSYEAKVKWMQRCLWNKGAAGRGGPSSQSSHSSPHASIKTVSDDIVIIVTIIFTIITVIIVLIIIIIIIVVVVASRITVASDIDSL